MSASGQYKSQAYPAILRSVLLALGVVIAIFIIYEIVERLWFQDIDIQTLHLLHLMRGFFTSLVAAILVGWFILKASPSLFTSSASADSLAKPKWPREQERMDNFNRWFILMRWIAVLVAWLLSFLIVQVAQWLPEEVWTPLIITISSLVVLNLFYEYIYQKGLFKQYLLPLQAYADLVMLAILLHFSGGIENPLSLLMLFHVIIAGIVLNRGHCYSVATAASILLATVAAGETTGIIDHYTLTIFPHVLLDGELAHASHQPFYVINYVGLMTVIFFLTAYFVTTLAERIHYGERQLEKFADHALQQRQLIEKALETTDTGLCVCYCDGQPYWTNERWRAWFGQESLHTYIENNQLSQTLSACKVVKAGKTHSCEITVPADDLPGEARTYRITTAPLFSTEGQMNHAVSLAQDITEQKKAQQQMMRAGKLAAVGELAGHVAHEVNNPIGIISAKCRLLLVDHFEEMTPKVRQEIEKIIGSANRVANIAKGLLSYCRPSAARRTGIDISSPIREALAMIGQHAKEINVDVVDRMPNELPLINANADEIQQVFLNLFLNALDAMPDGGTLQITTTGFEDAGKRSENWFVISVEDSGAGIPDDIKDNIFEPFFTTKEDGKGTGLGLSVCSGLIRSHNGTIKAESHKGQGSRFMITLPVISNKQRV